MKTGRGLDLEPLDRLEEKVRTLVAYVDRLRGELAAAQEDNTRLRAEAEGLGARLAAAQDVGTEVSALRQERDRVRARVSDLLEQLEGIELAELRR